MVDDDDVAVLPFPLGPGRVISMMTRPSTDDHDQDGDKRSFEDANSTVTRPLIGAGNYCFCDGQLQISRPRSHSANRVHQIRVRLDSRRVHFPSLNVYLDLGATGPVDLGLQNVIARVNIQSHVITLPQARDLAPIENEPILPKAIPL